MHVNKDNKRIDYLVEKSMTSLSSHSSVSSVSNELIKEDTGVLNRLNGRIKSGIKNWYKSYGQLLQTDGKKRAKTASNKTNNFFSHPRLFKTPREMEKDQIKRMRQQIKDIEYWHINKKNYDSKKRTLDSCKDKESLKSTTNFQCKEGKVKIETFIQKMEKMKGISQNLLKMDTVQNHLKANARVRCKTGTLKAKERARRKELQLQNIMSEMSNGFMEYHIKLDVNVNNISYKPMHGSTLWIRKDIVRLYANKFIPDPQKFHSLRIVHYSSWIKTSRNQDLIKNILFLTHNYFKIN